MPENKGKKKDESSRPASSESGGPSAVATDGPDYAKVYDEAKSQAGADTKPFDLADLLAVGGIPVELPITPGKYAPVPVTFLGHDYEVGRVYTGTEVMEFFDLMRVKGEDVTVAILEKVLTAGDPAQLWADVGERNIFESNRIFEGIYKIAGLMSLSGKFLAS